MTLCGSLRATTTRALDPIVVAAIGKQYFVLDGHHRLDAYHTAQWKGPVPVSCYSGTLKEAEAAALRLNVKNKLPMTRDGRSEAAWRMMVAGAKDPAWKRTHEQVMEAAVVGEKHRQAHGSCLEETRRLGVRYDLGRRAERRASRRNSTR